MVEPAGIVVGDGWGGERGSGRSAWNRCGVTDRDRTATSRSHECMHQGRSRGLGERQTRLWRGPSLRDDGRLSVEFEV